MSGKQLLLHELTHDTTFIFSYLQFIILLSCGISGIPKLILNL